MDILKSKLKELSGGKILDVATQGGSFVDDMKSAFKDYDKAIGIDISDKKFDEGRQKFAGEPVEFIVMDGCNLTFDDESFDTVSISNGMHHMPDIGKAFAEMYRVLKPGGLFIIYEVCSGDLTEKQKSDELRHHFKVKVDRAKGESHNYTLEKQEILNYADNLGLASYEHFDFHCTECDPEEQDKIAEREKDIDDMLDSIKDYPEYEVLKIEAKQIKQRFRDIGYECATNLIVIGRK
ncbi:MAG: class I SAM-dependent methyltransferase [candidate division Zixibacteria bacterium]|nr:class I SAM-dependent methyltransferase [candidate division Zixibacteria bacterium]